MNEIKIDSGSKVWVFKSDTQRIEEAIVVDVAFCNNKRFVRVLEDDSDTDSTSIYVYGMDCFSSRESLYDHFLRVFGVASDKYGSNDGQFAFLRELQDICDYFGREEADVRNKIKSVNEVQKSRYMGESDGISWCRGRLLARLNALKMIREAMNNKQ